MLQPPYPISIKPASINPRALIMGILAPMLVFFLSAVATVNSHAKTLLILGDSLSAAYGMPIEQGWVHLLEQKIEPQDKVVNASVGGHTTADGLAQLPKLLTTYKPDLVLVALGGNDGLRGYQTTTVRTNLLSIVKLVEQNGAQVILAGIQIPPSYGSRYTKQFKDVFPKLAEDKKLPLVPFLLEGVPLNPDLMQADGIHPNSKGQPQILANVWPVIKPLLQQ